MWNVEFLDCLAALAMTEAGSFTSSFAQNELRRDESFRMTLSIYYLLLIICMDSHSLGNKLRGNDKGEN